MVFSWQNDKSTQCSLLPNCPHFTVFRYGLSLRFGEENRPQQSRDDVVVAQFYVLSLAESTDRGSKAIFHYLLATFDGTFSKWSWLCVLFLWGVTFELIQKFLVCDFSCSRIWLCLSFKGLINATDLYTSFLTGGILLQPAYHLLLFLFWWRYLYL